MQTFKITRHLEVACESQNTRYGFRHLAHLLRDGREVADNKCCYYNRTWERYEFESVIKGLLDVANKGGQLSAYETREFKKMIKNGGVHEIHGLKTVAGIMALGDILGRTQKESNDWKTRIIKAGLGNKGLIMPEDWEKLDENMKQARLNGAIKLLS